MGIGRRKFLQLFGATIAAAAVDPLQSIVLSDDLYINRALGIAFRKPRGWTFLSLKDFGKLRNAQVIKDDELADSFLNAEEPFAIIAKSEPNDPRKVDACITLYLEDLPLEENETLAALVPKLEGVMQRILENYSHTSPATEMLISGCESVQYFARFQFETGMLSVPARNRCLITARGRQLYTVNMFDYPRAGVIAQHEYDLFVDSIRYV